MKTISLLPYYVLFVSVTVTTTTAASDIVPIHSKDDDGTVCTIHELKEHPMLCEMLYRSKYDLSNFVDDIYDWTKSNQLLVDVAIENHDNNKSNDDVTIDKNNMGTTTTALAIPRLVESTISLMKRFMERYWIRMPNSDNSMERPKSTLRQQHQAATNQQLPVVFAHGMGDSCYNDGMIRITQYVSKLLNNVYTVCIPIGSSREEDTKNGYLLNMDASVDLFEQAIRMDIQLQNGFHAIGFSQGNNIIRGYIIKYNTPTVHTFLSVNGVNAGIGAVPYCIPHTNHNINEQYHNNNNNGSDDESTHSTNALDDSTMATTVTTADRRNVFASSMCNFLMEQASRQAYTEFAQKHSFQANYWRDPRKSAWPMYQKYSQLAAWNNEGGSINIAYVENFLKTTQYVWVIALEDGMVWPKEGEQWGMPNSNAKDPFAAPVLLYNETDWYIQDLFGLRSAEELGKNKFDSFNGDHLQFTSDDLQRWVTTYLKQE